MSREKPANRADYRQFVALTTRWADNDVYGHINNVAYYGFIDTAVNQLLIEAGVLDVEASTQIGVVVESGCRYHASAHYPDTIHAGVRVGHLGNSSVRYEVGLFRNDEDQAIAEGFFVHVFVGREDRRPQAMSAALKAYLQTLT
ncbi:thioesterase family protein [uncultured Brevundimonas sp.]|uniref:acyl-CoA thioesterase n=1 Tax=uncultured Brevundimonas sp. TaxID=213418 RepID=UPI002602BFEB|nr:thioesterase family protein [uncultured Brevundimonas sp.]